MIILVNNLRLIFQVSLVVVLLGFGFTAFAQVAPVTITVGENFSDTAPDSMMLYYEVDVSTYTKLKINMFSSDEVSMYVSPMCQDSCHP